MTHTENFVWGDHIKKQNLTTPIKQINSPPPKKNVCKQFSYNVVSPSCRHILRHFERIHVALQVLVFDGDGFDVRRPLVYKASRFILSDESAVGDEL